MRRNQSQVDQLACCWTLFKSLRQVLSYLRAAFQVNGTIVVHLDTRSQSVERKVKRLPGKEEKERKLILVNTVMATTIPILGTLVCREEIPQKVEHQKEPTYNRTSGKSPGNVGGSKGGKSDSPSNNDWEENCVAMCARAILTLEASTLQVLQASPMMSPKMRSSCPCLIRTTEHTFRPEVRTTTV